MRRRGLRAEESSPRTCRLVVSALAVTLASPIDSEKHSTQAEDGGRVVSDRGFGWLGFVSRTALTEVTGGQR